MRAALFESFGTAADVLRIGEIETPNPARGEVLVRLHSSGISPSDVKKRAGSFPNLLDRGFIVPNSDGAGIIEAVGEGVDIQRVGERVWIYQAQFERRFGTAAEYVTIDSERAPRLPDSISFEIGASLGIPAMTAHRAVFADGDVEGKTILVTGGAGRVGYYAIQWAHLAGATVVASASNDADEATCRRAGAQHVVNHRSDNLVEQIMLATAGKPVDRVVEVEFGSNLPTSVEVLKVGGVIATYSSTQIPEPRLPFYQLMYKDLVVRTIIVYAMPEDAKRHAVADIGSALENGTLQHRIAATFPLSDIIEASEVIEQGRVRGAVVLTIN